MAYALVTYFFCYSAQSETTPASFGIGIALYRATLFCFKQKHYCHWLAVDVGFMAFCYF